MCVRAWVTACLIHLCHDALAWLAHLHTLAPTQTRAYTAGKSCWLDPPACSTLNPQPSTLNPEWQAKAAGSNRRHVQEQEFSGLRLSFAPLFVRAYEWACVLASCCVRAQAIACFCARLRLQACLSACVCCRTNRMRHARESTHSSTNSLGHDSDRR